MPAVKAVARTRLYMVESLTVVQPHAGRAALLTIIGRNLGVEGGMGKIGKMIMLSASLFLLPPAKTDLSLQSGGPALSITTTTPVCIL